MTQVLPEWASQERPAFVVPIGLPPRVVEAWVRTAISMTERITIFLVPAFTNSPWYKNFFEGNPRLVIPVREVSWWIKSSFPPRCVLRHFHVFVKEGNTFLSPRKLN